PVPHTARHCYLSHHLPSSPPCSLHPRYFFFSPAASTQIYTLSLHDALPILRSTPCKTEYALNGPPTLEHAPIEMHHFGSGACSRDRKSTRLNSSHQIISYAVFCLKKKTLSWFRCAKQRQLLPEITITS